MKDLIYFLKQIHQYTGKKLYINLIAITFSGVLEGVSTILLITLINATNIVDLGIMNKLFISFMSFLNQLPSGYAIAIILLLYLLVAIGAQLLSKTISIRNVTLLSNFLRKLRLETYQALVHAKWSLFLKHRKSDMINIVNDEVTEVGRGIQSVLQLFSTLMYTVIQISIALILSPMITMFVLLSGLLLVVINRGFLKKSFALGRRNYELGMEYFGGLTDQINGIKDIKSNSLEESRLDWFNDITKKMEVEQISYATVKQTSYFYYKCASAVFIVMFIFISFAIFNSQAGQLILIILIFSRLWPQVTSIQSHLENIASELPSIKVVKEFQQECQSLIEFQDEDYQNVQPLKVRNSIECQNVYFKYELDEERQALENINLTIKVNQMTALVGKSGAGKSTLIDLLMGLNLPDTGEVLVDGIPLTQEKLLALRKSLSYVPQDPFLFNTTIRENISITKEDATEEEIWEALTFASAREFVERLPNGLDTVIGDRGIKLSGGERQRLVLARAILKKPALLILDEATSALDSESESRIKEAIDSLKGKMTIIVIAHRLSTIQNADQVIVLEDGRIIQQGSFIQLAREGNKAFSQLLRKQQLNIASIG